MSHIIGKDSHTFLRTLVTLCVFFVPDLCLYVSAAFLQTHIFHYRNSMHPLNSISLCHMYAQCTGPLCNLCCSIFSSHAIWVWSLCTLKSIPQSSCTAQFAPYTLSERTTCVRFVYPLCKPFVQKTGVMHPLIHVAFRYFCPPTNPKP